MRRFVLCTIAFVMAATAASAESLTVRLDQSTRVHLSAPARDVVIGNPNVADVSMMGARDMLVLGKTYGVTNLVVVDRAGRTIYEREVVVSAPGASMSFYRGGEVRTFACGDRCERIPTPGGDGAKSDSGSAAPAPTPSP
jgi:Flp pilus assembly secretin CpaC